MDEAPLFTTPPTAAPTEPAPPTITADPALLQQCEEYKQAALRATADYRNLQRETALQLADIGQFATRELLLELCPLVDYFASALAAIPAEQQSQGWVQGIKHLQDYVMNLLRNHQVERMQTIGQPFDPSQHESVGAEDNSEQPDHTILKEVQAGFLCNGKVLRPARVIIATASNPNPNPNQTQTVPPPV